MSYNSFTNTSISTQSHDTFRSATHTYKMRFSGLRPNTKHKMYLEDVDYTWACKGWGQNLGEDLLSSSDGNLTVYVLYEIPFSRPSLYENKETQSVAFYSNKFNNQNKRMEDVVDVQWKTFEVRSADNMSHAATKMHFHIVLINGDYNRQEQHD